MSTELATVVSVESGIVKVIPERQSSCHSCSVKGGCGISVLSQLVGKKQVAFVARSTIQVSVGDSVIISLRDGVLLLVSFVVYLLPIVLMGVGGLIFPTLLALTAISMTAEAASITGIFAGLAVGLLASRLFFNFQSHNPRFYPVIIGKTTLQPT